MGSIVIIVNCTEQQDQPLRLTTTVTSQAAYAKGCSSVNRHSASTTQSPQTIHRQPRMDALNVLVARLCEHTARQVARFVAKCHVYINLIIHGGIVSRAVVDRHSFFPVVVFVHSCNVNSAGA